VYKSLKALSEVDSVTVDPHKLGYIPYPAGAIMSRDSRMRDLISYQPPYIYHESEKEKTSFIGGYILEGSKPGAVAGACWLAHRTIPLDSSGYGVIIGETIRAAQELYGLLWSLNTREPPPPYRVRCLTRPDLNMVCFIVNKENNNSLEEMNKLNNYLYERFSVTPGDKKSVYAQDFYITKTEFRPTTYRSEKCIDSLLRSVGVSKAEFFTKGIPIIVLRCSVFSPWLSKLSYGTDILERFVESLHKAIMSYIGNMPSEADESEA